MRNKDQDPRAPAERMPEELEPVEPVLTSLKLDEAPGPARRISADRAAALVEHALDAWQNPARTAPAARGPSRRLLRALATAAVIAAAGSAAAYAVHQRLGDARRSEAEPHAATPANVPAPIVPAEPRREAAPAGSDEPEPELEGARAPKAPAPSPPAPAPPPPPSEAAPAVSTPSDWLERANRLRAEGRWAEAERTYARVLRESPSGASAYVARIAAASIRLDHLGDAGGAVRLLEGALSKMPGGPLDIEARETMARAQRRLGNRAGERAALAALVSAHPSSRAAQRARERLSDLDASR